MNHINVSKTGSRLYHLELFKIKYKILHYNRVSVSETLKLRNMKTIFLLFVLVRHFLYFLFKNSKHAKEINLA